MSLFNIFPNRERESTLCHSCVYAHVVEGVRGNLLTSCTFGYTLRPIKFGVSVCSGYTNRSTMKSVTVVRGFVAPNDDHAKVS